MLLQASVSVTGDSAVRLLLNRADWYRISDDILACGPAERQMRATLESYGIEHWRQFSPEALGEVLSRLNGFFALILISEHRVVFAVDKVRSIPLFYTCDGGKVHVSDDAGALGSLTHSRTSRDNLNIDPTSAAEFLSGLYLNGSRTLHPDILQVQAGEWVESVSPHLAANTTARDYFRLVYRFDGDESDAWFEEGLSQSINQAIDNLLEVAGDRQIVLPLSGGYDSRLLALALVDRGAANLLAFSYGEREDALEVAFARQVAKTLSIDWIFIPDVLSDWKAAWQTEARKQYGHSAANLSSFPLFQDWLAVKGLQATGKLDNDAIFCPGHTGDFVSGGKIPQSIISHRGELTYQSRVSGSSAQALKQMARLMAEREFTHCNVGAQQREIEHRIHDCFIDANSQAQPVDAEFLIRQLQDWNWRQRQAKYIVNSVRVYEHHGYAWWLPLWDNAVIDFWRQVPLPRLLGRSSYIQYVKTAYIKATESSAELKYSTAVHVGSAKPALLQSGGQAEMNNGLDNASGNLWVRNPVMRRLRALLPFSLQERARELKVRMTERLSTSSIRPVRSQPFSRVYGDTEKVETRWTCNGVATNFQPSDALGGLAIEFLREVSTEMPLPANRVALVKNLNSDRHRAYGRKPPDPTDKRWRCTLHESDNQPLR